MGVLAHRMRGSLLDVLDDNGQIDLRAMRDLDLGHMIERITVLNHVPVPQPAGDSDETSEPKQTVRLYLNSRPEAANQIARILRADNPAARNIETDRLIFKIQNALVEFDDELKRSEPGLSEQEVFSRFVEEQSQNWGFDLRMYAAWILQDIKIGAASVAHGPAEPVGAGNRQQNTT